MLDVITSGRRVRDQSGNGFDRGNGASIRTVKVYAHIAFNEPGPVALAAAPELDAITSVSLAQSERRRSCKHVLKNPNLERHLRCRTARKGAREVSLQRGHCARRCVSGRARTLRWPLDFSCDDSEEPSRSAALTGGALCDATTNLT